MNKLKELREAKGWTREQLAEKSGVSVRSIEGYEQGKLKTERMALATAVNIAKALRCKPQDLL